MLDEFHGILLGVDPESSEHSVEVEESNLGSQSPVKRRDPSACLKSVSVEVLGLRNWPTSMLAALRVLFFGYLA